MKTAQKKESQLVTGNNEVRTFGYLITVKKRIIFWWVFLANEME